MDKQEVLESRRQLRKDLREGDLHAHYMIVPSSGMRRGAWVMIVPTKRGKSFCGTPRCIPLDGNQNG